MNALVNILNFDKTNPEKSNFQTEDGYAQWNEEVRQRFPKVLAQVLTDKFIGIKQPKQRSETKVSLLFKIISATSLLCKEGKVRDAMASIELSNPNSERKEKEREVFNTEVVQSNDPVWNQHMTLKIKNLTDVVLINVFCKRKEEFLGTARINVGDLVSQCARKGIIQQTLVLVAREGKKDRFAGGEVLIEANLDKQVYNLLQ